MANPARKRRRNYGMALSVPETVLTPRQPAPRRDEAKPTERTGLLKEPEPTSPRASAAATGPAPVLFGRGQGPADADTPGRRPAGGWIDGCLPLFFALAILAILVALVMTAPNLWRGRSGASAPAVLATAPTVQLTPTVPVAAPVQPRGIATSAPRDPSQPRPTATRALRGGPLPTPTTILR